MDYLLFQGPELLLQAAFSATLRRLWELTFLAPPSELTNPIGSPTSETLLVVSLATGEQVDFALHPSWEETLRHNRPPFPVPASASENLDSAEDPDPAENPNLSRLRGRPKLGVQGKEVTLLPRHWRWLELQPGGASATLRRLIDRERQARLVESQIRERRDATYRFLRLMAGNLPGYEEALRCLFRGNAPGLLAAAAAWPGDIAQVALRLWQPAPPSSEIVPGAPLNV